MKTYALTESGIAALQRRNVIRIIPMFLALMLALWLFTKSLAAPPGQSVAILSLIAAVLLFSFWNAHRQNVSVFKSIRISLDHDRIVRTQLRLPDMAISRGEMQSMQQHPGGLLVRGTAGNIFILAGLGSYDELVADLQQWGRIDAPSAANPLLKLLAYAVPFLVIAAMVAVYTSPRPVVILCAGIPLEITMIAALVMVRASKYVDSKIKRHAWFILLPIAAVLFIDVVAAIALWKGYPISR